MSLILVVEDDDDIRDYLVLRLERLGHDVVAAADGRSGLELAGSAVPTWSSPTGRCPGLPASSCAPRSGSSPTRATYRSW